MSSGSLKGKKALIIDDFAGMRNMLKTNLQSMQCEDVSLACNGDEAISLIESNYYDFILCDYDLGVGKNGPQVLEEAKYRDILPFSTAFVVIASEKIRTEMILGLMDHMPDDFVQKPITRTILESRLGKLFERKARLAEIGVYLHSKSRDYTKALHACNRELAAGGPPSLELLILKGNILYKLGDYKGASAHFQKLFELRETPTIALMLGQSLFYENRLEEAESVFKKVIGKNANYAFAFDWLAKIKERQGNLKQSQQLLQIAIKKSPSSVPRQRGLGEISFKNQDFFISEKAFQQAIDYGENSCYKSHVDYTGLAKSLSENNQPDEALKVVEKLKATFADKDEALFQAAIVESRLYIEMEDEEASLKAANEAMALYQKNPHDASGDQAISLAEAFLALGQSEQAMILVTDAVRNQHDDVAFLQQVGEIFAKAGLAKEGNALVEKTAKVVMETNNRGVQLAQLGKLDESIALFVEAVKSMPKNIIINLNTAKSLIMLMRKEGATKENLDLAKYYLDKVASIDPANKQQHELMALLRQLSPVKTKKLLNR